MKNRIKLGITTLLLTSSISIQDAPIQWTECIICFHDHYIVLNINEIATKGGVSK